MAPPKTFIELYKRIKGDVTTLTSVLATIRLVADNPGKMKLLDANVLELYHEIFHHGGEGLLSQLKLDYDNLNFFEFIREEALNHAHRLWHGRQELVQRLLELQTYVLGAHVGLEDDPEDLNMDDDVESMVIIAETKVIQGMMKGIAELLERVTLEPGLGVDFVPDSFDPGYGYAKPKSIAKTLSRYRNNEGASSSRKRGSGE